MTAPFDTEGMLLQGHAVPSRVLSVVQHQHFVAQTDM